MFLWRHSITDNEVMSHDIEVRHIRQRVPWSTKSLNFSPEGSQIRNPDSGYRNAYIHSCYNFISVIFLWRLFEAWLLFVSCGIIRKFIFFVDDDASYCSSANSLCGIVMWSFVAFVDRISISVKLLFQWKVLILLLLHEQPKQNWLGAVMILTFSFHLCYL